MARLPDLDSLGARPIPQSRRGVASNPRAGAVGQALEGFGENVTRIGQGMVEKEDRLAYAAAKSALLTADVRLRQELETDPDYETWGARYTEGMAREREAAAGLIRSNSDRKLFAADANLDMTRGLADLGEKSNARRVSAGEALGMETLDGLQDVYQNAPDEATREATINTANETIHAMRDRGYIDDVRAGELRRSTTQAFVVQRIEALRAAEDYEGAMAVLEANRGRLDGPAESQMFRLLTDALSNREELTLAEQFFNGSSVTTPAAPGAAAPAAAPVEGTRWSVISRPGAPRDGGRRVHKGYDIAPTAGAPGWYPTQDFRIENPRTGERQGLTADVILADGTRLTLMHLASLPSTGSYKAGQLAAIAGNTGNARTTPTHFHVEGKDKDGRSIDPSGHFGTGTGGAGPASGQPSARRRDLGVLYDNIDAAAAAGGWKPEKTERVKAQTARLVEREDNLLNREQDDAYEAALAKAETLGDNFTDPSQLGDVYYRASETQQRTLRNIADANLAAAAGGASVKANGDQALFLDNLQDRDPAQFASENLFQYRHELTPAEFSKFLDDQRRIEIEGPSGQHATTRSAITSTINFYGPEIGITAADLNATSEDSAAKRERRARYIALKDRMEADLRRLTGGTRAATEDEIKGAFDRATIQVTQGGERVSRFEIDPAAGNVTVPVPRAIKQRILNAWRQAGRGTPTEIQIAQEYMRNKGREGFW